MTTDPKRVKDIFLAAAELPDEAAQVAYLEQACGGDAGLRERVEALLRSHDPAGSFLGTPAAVLADSDVAAQQTIDSACPGGPGPEKEAEDLGFLSLPTRPDSLGRIGHYEVLQVLGKGGFGIVFRAFDDILQRVVAIKVMAPQLAATSPARKRFLREAQSSAKVRHENVVQVYEVGEQPLPYLAMEFIPGETLQQRLDRTGPLDVSETLRIGRQIAEGLAAAHATDLIHRDIKPGNVLLEGGQHKVKITDFGLARAADDASMTQSGMIAGTPMYMAPEQALGQTLDQRADLFSLGSVLYQAVAGRAPFRANTTVAVLKRVAEDTPRPIREVIPETPQWLCDIITKLHAKKPEDRYQSAREVADVLADCEAQLKTNSKLQDFSRIPRAQRQPLGHRKALAIATAIFLLPLIALAVTECTGVTKLFQGSRAKVLDPVEPKVGPPLVPVANQELPSTFKNSIGMEFVIVPKGKSWLGGGKDKLGDKEVEIPADFYLGKYEVTQEEWERVMGENPSYHSRTGEGKDTVEDISDADLKRFPIENVSWNQCQIFVAKLNKLEKQAGWVYRLPKEAEWEYACRGGPMTDKLDSAFDFYFAKPTNILLSDQANIKGNRTCKVGSYQPNALGLFDMHGNAWEWCEDANQAEDTSRRVFRGGAWDHHSKDSRVTDHPTEPPSIRHNNIGFRLARVPSSAPSPEAKTPPLAKQEPLPPTHKNTLGMEFVLVPKGKSWLGGEKDKPGDREVKIRADFYLGKYEVTQEEWEKVMGENPSYHSRTGEGKDAVEDVNDAELKRFPVEMVSWDQTQLFVAKLNELEKETGWVYRLPKVDEWEYACRGGPMSDKGDSAFDFYLAKPTNTLLPDTANVTESRKNGTCAVGSYQPNRLGLCDMHGNVWEWCETELKGHARGGCCFNSSGEWVCRAGQSFWFEPANRFNCIGLRLARVPSTKTPQLAIAPFDAAQAKAHQNAWASHLGVQVETTNSIGMKFVLIPPGEFTMGSSEDEIDQVLASPGVEDWMKAHLRNESQAHRAAVREPFLMGIHEVTIGQFRAFVEATKYQTQAEKSGGGVDWSEEASDFTQQPECVWNNPKYALSETQPVTFMERDDTAKFCAWLSEKEGRQYQIPTDEQWEFACRAGTATRFFFGDEQTRLKEFGWTLPDSEYKAKAVGLLRANPFGLFDTLGNADELTVDSSSSPMERGGNGRSPWQLARSATGWARKRAQSFGGFRVVIGGDLRPRTSAPGSNPVVKHEPLSPTYKNTLGMEFVIVPKGKSWLGGGKDKLGDREVEIPADFYLGKYEVTQEEWEKVMGENPSRFSPTGARSDQVKGISAAELKRFPVETVSWDQCQTFVAKLNQLEKDSGWVYRLPTEVEWEYACRGGPMSDGRGSHFDFYLAEPTNTLLQDQANFGDQLHGWTCKVGSYKANRLGLHEMHGNIREWCHDEIPSDPKDPKAALMRADRGGPWSEGSMDCRATSRCLSPPENLSDNLGLRLARVPSGDTSPTAKTPLGIDRPEGKLTAPGLLKPLD